MRDIALTRRQARVLEAVAAAQAANESQSLARIAERVPLRADLVEVVAADLSKQGLLAFHGEYVADDNTGHPGPELRVTKRGQRVLEAARDATPE